MNLVDTFPSEIIQLLKDYMWGTHLDYRVKLRSILDDLPKNVQLNLSPIKYGYYKNSIWEDVDDNLFCPSCGEKTLWFPSYCNGNVCEYCQYR